MAIKVDHKFLQRKSGEISGWKDNLKGVRENVVSSVLVQKSFARNGDYDVSGALFAAKETWDAAARIGMQELGLLAAVLKVVDATVDITEMDLADQIASQQRVQ
jgi:hypothetical protein